MGDLRSVSVTRRVVTRAAAWSAPVVALAAAAPAAAASETDPRIEITSACRLLSGAGAQGSAPEFTVTVGLQIGIDSTFALDYSRANVVQMAMPLLPNGWQYGTPNADFTHVPIHLLNPLPEGWSGNVTIPSTNIFGRPFEQTTMTLSTGTIVDADGNPTEISVSASKTMAAAGSSPATIVVTCS